MAAFKTKTVETTTTTNSSVATKPAISAPPPKDFSLPMVASVPITKLEQCKVLLYGQRKIGKTSLAAQFENPLFFMFEPGGDGLRIRKVDIATWADFRGYATELMKQPRSVFQTAVIDTADIAYDRCKDWVCRQNGVKSIIDIPYGQGWGMVKTEFQDWIDRMIRAKLGVVLTSHAQVTEFQGRTGQNYNKIIPSMSKQAASYVLGVVDVIAYYGYFGNDRLLTLQGSDNVEAGCRLAENFLVQGTQQQVHSIPMTDPDNPNFREREAYENLVKAFNNEQEDTGEPDAETTLETRAAKIMKK